MIESIYAQLRFGYSVLSGRPFSLRALERMVDSLAATRSEFGSVGKAGAELVGGPSLSGPALRDLQTRRLRMVARRAARETPYYGGLFQSLELDPDRLGLDDFRRVPLTPKSALMERPASFVRSGASPAFLTTSTGTTGTPTQVLFSANEIQQTVLLNAITSLVHDIIGPEDVIQVNTSSRATLGNQCFTRSCERLGAMWYLAGLVDPKLSLRLLTQARPTPGKHPRASYISAYPSYLGQMVTHGLASGMRPTDFGLHTVSIGGEVVTEGLQRRAMTLFGDVRYVGGYAMTETWPFGGQQCEEGHLHFEPGSGLLEILDPDTNEPAAPGAIGKIVATPFPPYRDASVVLRYDTGDLVRALPGPQTCSKRHMPATSAILGKRHLSLHHDSGWTTPRDVLESVEGVDAVPLPGRVAYWLDGRAVAAQVVAPGATRADHREVGQALESRGVPLKSLELVEDPGLLRSPIPLRGDLRELSFQGA
ncbi:MAG: AMP-binding protein [Anaerolineae bacterium]